MEFNTKKILRETIREILSESQESKSIDEAKKLVMQRLGYDRNQADEFIRIKLRNDLPVLRDKNAAKFILGVTRMFLDKQIQDAQTINNLNTTLKYVASEAHINEYDRNLNDMSAQTLINRFSQNIEMDLENDKNEVNAMQFTDNSNYEIIKIDSFEQACEYNVYTYKESPWCLTYSRKNYDSYTSDGMNQIYFCLRNGFQYEKPIEGEGCPLDEYGLSMISVIVDADGSLTYCTSRWNHANGGNDSIMDTKELSQVIGKNFYQTFKPNTKWQEHIDNLFARVRNGEPLNSVFDWTSSMVDGYTVVKTEDKYNLIDEQFNLVSKQWYDKVGFFSEGYAVVEKNDRRNWMDKKGNILSSEWFRDCGKFDYGATYIKSPKTYKYNFVDLKANILYEPNDHDKWFDDFSRVSTDCYKVRLYTQEKNNIYNVFNTKLKKLVSPNQWFDWIDSYSMDDIKIKVELNGKKYWLNLETGELYDPKTKELVSLSESKIVLKTNVRDLLRESKRDDFLNQYLPLLQKRGIETSVGQLKSFLLKKFADEFGIHSLSKGSNFYLAGVTRYYFEGLLTTNKRLNVLYPNVKDKPITELCTDLDILIDILRNSYIDSVGTKYEQPEDFGTLPLDKLLKKYNRKISKEKVVNGLQGNNEQIEGSDSNTNAGKNYTYEILNSYEEAKRFEQYTRPGAWCITYNKAYYNDYKRKLGIHYVVFMRKDFENVPRKVGKGFTKEKPHDEYGNSLICVLQSNKSPEPIYITSRWNHGSSQDEYSIGYNTAGTEADHAYTKEEFLNVIGCDESVLQRCFEQWKNRGGASKDKEERKKQKEYSINALRYIKYAQMMISNGARLQDFFNDIEVLVGNPEKPNKSIAIVGFENNEFPTKVYTLYDRGKLCYDTFFYQDATKPTCKVLNNNILVFNYDYRNEFYNIKTRSFILADGIKTFRASAYIYNMKKISNEPLNRYISVWFDMRNGEKSILDTEKGEFLKTPSGKQIFLIATLNDLNTTKCDSSIDKNDILLINNTLIFDVNSNEFKNLRTRYVEDNPDGNTIWVVSLGSLAPKGYLKYNNFRGEGVKFINIDTEETLDIQGNTEFSFATMACHKRILVFLPVGVDRKNKKTYFYDTETSQVILLNGQPLYAEYNYRETSDDFLVCDVKENDRNLFICYSIETHDFIRGESTNSIYFYDIDKRILTDRYGYATETFLIVTELNGCGYKLKTQSTLRESIKKDFYAIFNKIMPKV